MIRGAHLRFDIQRKRKRIGQSPEGNGTVLEGNDEQ